MNKSANSDHRSDINAVPEQGINQDSGHSVDRTVLWWGNSDINYSRNRICRQALQALGYRIIDFKPWFGRMAHWQARLMRLPKPDLVWVPCFRQRDIAAARKWATRQQVPLVVDPLISAWDKQVFERQKFAPDSRRARRLQAWESALLQSADVVLVDTPLHGELFARALGVNPERIFTVYVGAEQPLFGPVLQPIFQAAPQPLSSASHVKERRIEVLFYGSFIGLHGVETIIEAAKLASAHPHIVWTLLGDGPQKARCMTLAEGYANIRFEDAVPYSQLPGRIAAADILLGVFGGSAKAGNVIPNKVFQALACAKPVISRLSLAYPLTLQVSVSGMQLIAPENAQALYQAVLSWAEAPEQLAAQGQAARLCYEENFSAARISQQLQTALASIPHTPLKPR